MFIVGIDIAKHTHVAAIMDLNGKVLGKPFKFSNTSEGFERLLTNITAVCQDITQIRFGMEATGHYCAHS